jgi:predicted ATPase
LPPRQFTKPVDVASLIATSIADRQRAKLFQLRASTSLARLWRDQSRHAEARGLLGPIYNWFTEGFDARDLMDAKVLLNELALAGRSRPPTA